MSISRGTCFRRCARRWPPCRALWPGLSNMAISNRGPFPNPAKSPWNFELYHSDLEKLMMMRLEKDPHVVKWMKRHGITIPWIDGQKHQRRCVPDFLVQYE